MIRIGLTGPSGSGKGEFSALLAPYGIKSIDTDRVYHDLLIPPSPCLDALVDAFGREILNPDHTLSRPRLASIVFSEGSEDKRRERLDRLNTITHRFVIEKTEEILSHLAKESIPAAVIDAPALYEAGMDKTCDLVVAVIADRETRIARIMARDAISRERATARVDGQHPDFFYTSRADAVLRNDGDRIAFTGAVEGFVSEFLPQLLH